MPIIDEQGRIFGVVNVIDAVVVLLVFSVVVAGAALLTQGDDSADTQPATEHRYVTIDFDTQPAYVISALGDGNGTISTGDDLSVTDVYAVPTGPNDYHLYARANVTAVSDDQRLTFRTEPLELGRSVSVSTPETTLSGTVVDMGRSESTLPIRETSFVASSNVSRDRAEQIREGDSISVLGERLATAESVSVYPTDEPNRRLVIVGVTAPSLDRGDTPTYGETPILRGDPIQLRMDDWHLEGNISTVGRTELPGTEERITANVTVSGVDPATASAIEPGMTERLGGRTLARVTDVSVEPEMVVVTSDSGEMYLREHPRKKDVHMTVELTVRESETGTWFHGTDIRRNDVVHLDLGTVRVDGRIRSLE